jgi:hypothetical protein
MKILSDFHDYYDSAAAYGIDETIVFIRKPKTIQIPWSVANEQADLFGMLDKSLRRRFDLYLGDVDRNLPNHWREERRDRITASPVLVYFCGGLRILWSLEAQGFELHRVIVRADEIFKTLATRKMYKPDPWSSDKTYEPPRKLKENFRRDTFEELWRFYSDLDGRLLPTVQDITGSPLAHIDFQKREDFIERSSGAFHPVHFHINPKLSSLSFQKLVDAPTAFQEIQMFLSNDMVQKDLAPRSVGGDRVLIKAKGFDEMSFRQSAPGQKKTNRKANRARKRGLSP